MERDRELIRSLLLEIENGRRSFELTNPEVAIAIGMTTDGLPSRLESQKLEYHLKLLETSGMIVCQAKLLGVVWQIDHITWSGHDFLDAIRDPKIWKATKAGADAAGGFSIELLKALAKGLIKKQIENKTGITLDL